MQSSPHRIEDGDDDRFARFRLINWWEQERLQNARVLVVGAGALGNEILKNLALLGIGNIFVIDLDDVENSNLCRSVLFRERDNGFPKAESAARGLADIYPGVKTRWLKGSVLCDIGLGVFAWADVVIGGLDNREARLAINRNCWRVGKPWIDGAIEQLNGVAKVFAPPNGACYECTMGKADWDLIAHRKSCAGLNRTDLMEGKVPTTPTAASVIAAVQCQEAVKLLHGMDVIRSRGFVFNGITCESYIVEYVQNEECLAHVTDGPARKLPYGVATMTLRQLLEEARRDLGPGAALELNRDIVSYFVCAGCDTTQPVFKCATRLSDKDATCPTCGILRRADTFDVVGGREEFLDRTFCEVNVPAFDMVVARNGLRSLAYEFSGDAGDALGSLLNSADGREAA